MRKSFVFGYKIGGIYSHKLEAIVPFFSSYIRAEWISYKNEIAERIGVIHHPLNKQSDFWENSSDSIDSLLLDAKIAEPYFRKKCIEIAKRTNSVANFGILDLSIIKSKKSLIRKVKQIVKEKGIPEEWIIPKIRDALRGTIIADIPEQIPSIVDAIKEFAHEEGQEVVFVNLWEESRPSGYVGIHAKMLLPIHEIEKKAPHKYIIVEIQIHLRCIMDGTKECVKEREHLLYDQMRHGGINPELQTAASTLLYLTALKQCPKKPTTKQ